MPSRHSHPTGYVLNTDLPVVALIGRPNVGKSTLFNRLIRGNRAITHDMPGVTRDRLYGTVRRQGRAFAIVDTGGVVLSDAGRPQAGPDALKGFEEQIFQQARYAVEEACVLVLVADAQEGLNPLDERLADFARRSGKPVLLAVNKADTPRTAELVAAEFHALGLPMLAVSSAHGHQLQELARRLLALLPETEEAAPAPAETAEETPPEETRPAAPAEETATGLRIALLGRPNVGKSSLVNALVGEERMIVSEIPGTTRDSVDITFETAERRCTFVDTAGVRRKARVTGSVEHFSVNASLQSAQRADVALLLLDASEGLTTQDKRLIAFLEKYKIPFLALVNKIDLVERGRRPAVMKLVREALIFCPHAPILGTSTKTGAGLADILPLAGEVWAECSLRVSTGVLNRAARQVVERHQPPLLKGRRAKFYYLTQAETKPPTFIFFVNDPERVMASYARYLENSLRELFGLKHAPLRLLFRGSHGEHKTD